LVKILHTEPLSRGLLSAARNARVTASNFLLYDVVTVEIEAKVIPNEDGCTGTDITIVVEY
jgi:hypothetical protein